MKNLALISLFTLISSLSIAQSGKIMDPETIHRPMDSTYGAVIQLEVTINSIRLLKVKSDSVIQARNFTIKKGSTVNISYLSDKESTGVPGIFTKLNHEPETRYYQPLRLVARGHHTLTVRAVTENGRESTMNLSFTVIE